MNSEVCQPAQIRRKEIVRALLFDDPEHQPEVEAKHPQNAENKQNPGDPPGHIQVKGARVSHQQIAEDNTACAYQQHEDWEETVHYGW